MGTAAHDISADSVLATLREAEPRLRAQGIQRLSLFGSVARGEADAASDVDLAAVLDRSAGLDLLWLVRMETDLAELLGRRVDLIPEPVEKQRLQREIDRDRKIAF